jgi:hypothetical protein
VPTVTAIRYGVFECRACIESDQSEDCGDHCSGSWPDDLCGYGDYWPMCKCCGAEAHLVAPLMTV